MLGSIFGTIFRVTTFGESHGPALGCVIDGCPAGLVLSPGDITADMQRRRPGYSPHASKRREADEVEILSGVLDGITTGAPIAMMVRNQDHNPAEYTEIARTFRPGHADYSYFAKYGLLDTGGGRASGRETAARVAAGAVAKKILREFGITVAAHVSSIGRRAEDLEDCIACGDSIGSEVMCKINGLKAGVGAPVFDKLSADLAKAVHSIGGVKGVEFGTGFAAATMRASKNNDAFVADGGGKISKTTNNAGGILGGISDGDEIYFRVAFKPPPSIAMAQQTVNADGKNTQIAIKGRHDPVLAPRACVVVEAMAACVVVDHIFRSLSDRMESVKLAYSLYSQ
ncbi:MAG: chorismate synthase [Defluviitaleaceae bacterium]|nr:chorismate synthase [Defluviitaleaceae bacterium]